jgi:hypothetical protein
MHIPHSRTLRARARRTFRTASLSALAAGILAAGACSPTDVLDVTDPDIINPSDVQSPAGANAVRLGALARLATATSGSGEFFMLSGLFADEFINGDSFIARQEIDQRIITVQNNFLTDANRALHRARLSGQQAVELLDQYSPSAPGWQKAEMHFVQAYVINTMAEHYCNGLIFSSVIEGREEFGSPISTQQAFEDALDQVNLGLAAVTGATANDNRVRNALKVLQGRILLNLNRYTEAAAAVAGVPNDFEYLVRHSLSTTSNYNWLRNNNERRYNVADNEGTNGINFVSAEDPRLPICIGGTPECAAIGVTNPLRDDLFAPPVVAMLWPARESEMAILKGYEARMIEAEAVLNTNPAVAIAAMNDARAAFNATLDAGVTPLPDLVDPGTPEARVDMLFRERAFWNFGMGARVGDLRRLIRQYGRSQADVFPVGAWQPGAKAGNYGTDVNFPVPQAEQNNPNASGCTDRNA